MDFLNLIRQEVCHADSLQLGPGPTLHCTVCQQSVLKIYDVINQPHADYFRSSQLAQAYAAWTGDDQVPMSFPLSHIEGIYDGVVVGQPLCRVQKSVRLLRALNTPFTTEATVQSTPDMHTFLADFLNILCKHPQIETDDEREAVRALMKSMHDIMSVNPFDTYFTVLVPFVQTSCPSWKPLPAEPEHPNLARELHAQMIRSHAIRNTFSRYAIPFDVLHIMVCCYACSCNMEVVANWALDFLARICRGEFFWHDYFHSPYVQKMQHLIRWQLRPTHNNDYYKCVIRPIKYGESKECYSSLWIPLHQLQTLLRKKFVFRNTSSEILDVAFQHVFPATLFTDYIDQLGFMMGYNHLIMTVNKRNGQLPKGAFKKARLIHDVVQRFVKKLIHFDGGNIKPIWNLDMLKLFFASDPEFHTEIKQVVRLLVMDEEKEEEKE